MFVLLQNINKNKIFVPLQHLSQKQRTIRSVRGVACSNKPKPLLFICKAPGMGINQPCAWPGRLREHTKIMYLACAQCDLNRYTACRNVMGLIYPNRKFNSKPLGSVSTWSSSGLFCDLKINRLLALHWKTIHYQMIALWLIVPL